MHADVSPRLSVVIPLYNKRDEVRRSLSSVLSQGVQDLEIIVVDDGSTDGGPELVRDTRDSRVRLVSQDNAGVAAARNRGVQESNSSLVAFLDADDEWTPDFPSTVLRLAEFYPQCAVFAAAYWRVYPDGQHIPIRLAGLPFAGPHGVLKDYFDVAARSDPPISSSAVAIKKSAILEIGGFPTGVTVGEDLLTWARLAARFPVAYCREPLAFFYAPGFDSDPSRRLPQTPDMVAEGLRHLLSWAEPRDLPGLRKYLSLWHRMRSLKFLRLNETDMALEELRNARSWGATLRSIAPYFVIAMLPGTWPPRAYRQARVLHRYFSVFRSRISRSFSQQWFSTGSRTPSEVAEQAGQAGGRA